MPLTWIGSEIVTKVRNITGEKTAEDITDADLLNRINDYYRNLFPLEVYVSDFEGWFTETFTDGDGDYDVSQDYLRLETPMTILDSDDVYSTPTFYQDKDEFFHLYPEEVTPTEDRPAALLLCDNVLYPRPVPDASYTFKAACIKKPTALTLTTAPPSLRWGPAIAYGTAIEMLMEDNSDEADELTPIYRYFLNKISQKKIMQKAVNQRATPRF